QRRGRPAADRQPAYHAWHSRYPPASGPHHGGGLSGEERRLRGEHQLQGPKRHRPGVGADGHRVSLGADDTLSRTRDEHGPAQTGPVGYTTTPPSCTMTSPVM